MTGPRHTRAPRTPCAEPSCPFLTRHTYCPMHTPTEEFHE